MSIHPRAGQPARTSDLVDLTRLVTAYENERPDPETKDQRVAFGTSGHRGSPLRRSYNEHHVLAIAQAVCEYRARQGTTGPLFLGVDTHGASLPAERTVLEVLAANGVTTMVDAAGGYTPTPVVSHAILRHNRGRKDGRADGIVVSPSHNPPEDGGIKYNPPHGGPADSDATGWIQDRANALLECELRGVARMAHERALAAPTTCRHDYLGTYVNDLPAVVDLDLVRRASVRIGVDPLGGASVAYWQRIAEVHGLDLTIVNPRVDATFGFMTLDWDGKIRMDCSSRYAMAGLIAMKDRFQVAIGNDADADRHGIVTPAAGLMNPNHYLATAIDYLFTHRPGWRADAAVGKTLVSSALIDRVVAALGRQLREVPVGFKWFVADLASGELGFGGEESAGASFLRRDGTVWTTDKDGIILGLLAAEITAVLGVDPGERYRELVARHGEPVYERVDAPATPAQKLVLGKLSPEQVSAGSLGGAPITSILTKAPWNGAPIGGLKVVTDAGWFAARPSGTEDVYKIYAESFEGEAHLRQLQQEAQVIVGAALAGS